MKFLDEAKIFLKGGNGGSGCLSFRREKNIPKGGPDGGDGGKGGYIYIKSYENLNTLIDFRYKQHFYGSSGKNGSGKKKTGSNGSNLIIKVPVGTQIFSENKKNLIKDFKESGDSFLIVRGGSGGKGNYNFKTSTNRAPRKFESGKIGEEKWIWLRLKLIADIGIVGLPNVGKSSLLKRLSSANPKVGNYPFTTLKPQLGVVRSGEKDVIIADLPGLIKGASDGIGLGHKFLAHIERCKYIIHMCDISFSVDQILSDYNAIRKELLKYGNITGSKKEILVFNKSDLINEEEKYQKLKNLKAIFKQKNNVISCKTRLGIKELIEQILELFRWSND